MKDILQQIQNLKEDFINLSEKVSQETVDSRNKAMYDLEKEHITNGRQLRKFDKKIGKLEKSGEASAQDLRNAYYIRRNLHDKFRDSLDAIRSLSASQEVLASSNPDKVVAKLGNDNPAKGVVVTRVLPKVSDNNSYNEIMTRILNLKEDFMNLIEVEGLGQPASDVPPSTNKIKKDKKTKNGKVELVSVEDELFPYDGNKREQYRQKIIDTINGMIQGTATLEDLLQIVRQKKIPVKEGREILEGRKPGDDIEPVANAYASESWRKVTELTEELVTYLKKSNKPMDKYEALLGKIISNRQKEEETSARRESDGTHDGIENSRNRQFEKRYMNKSNREQNPKDRAYYYATRDKKTPEEKIEASIARHEKKKQKKTPLEEALKLLEGLCVNDGRKDFFQHDVAGIGGTGVDAIRKITKQTFGRTKKV